MLGTAFSRPYYLLRENFDISLNRTCHQLCADLILTLIALGFHSAIYCTFKEYIVFPPLSTLKISVKLGKVISELRFDLRKYPN